MDNLIKAYRRGQIYDLSEDTRTELVVDGRVVDVFSNEAGARKYAEINGYKTFQLFPYGTLTTKF